MPKKGNIPLSKSDFIAVYRKKNRSVRHEYLTLATKYADMGAFMFTFTSSSNGTYSKLRLINEIKSYVTYLIANSKSEIYFFSNIELGHSLTNPHLHTQIWSDDKNAVQLIYDKVIAKFSLDKKRCSLSLPQRTSTHYNYVIKDYAETLTDEQVWKLEQTKKKHRKQLGLKLRFYSRSKSKYQSKLYKIVYHTYGVLRALADDWIEFFVNTFFLKKELREPILWSKKLIKSCFILIKNKGIFVFENSFLTLDFDFFFGDLISFYGFVPANAPPILGLRLDFNLKGDVLFYLLWILFFELVLIWVWLCIEYWIIFLCGYVGVIVFLVEVRCLSPPLLVFMLEK